jgi:hypothetical protein
MSTGSKSLRLADQLVREPWVWPGGYPLYGLMDDGGAICRFCAEEEREWIALTDGRDGWCVVRLEVNWEGEGMCCDCCGKWIEAAYGEEG